MKLNRKLQGKVLNALEEVYPDSLLVHSLPEFSHDREYMANLFYLQEHGLIAGGDIREPGKCRSMVDAQITKVGLDFIADDGGLAAILEGVSVSVKHHEIVETVEVILQQADIDDEMRSRVKQWLDRRGKDDLKQLLLKLAQMESSEKAQFICNLPEDLHG